LPNLKQLEGGNTSGQVRANKQYSLKDEHVVSLLKLLHKSNKFKLPEAKHPEEMGKTDDPNYCLYHRMVGYPAKSYYIFKDVLQALIDADVLKLRPEQKKVIANMISLQFGRDLVSVPARVLPIPKRELKVVNIDPHHKEEKGLVPIPTAHGEIMWVYPDIMQSLQWTIVTNRKSKGKARTSFCKIVCASSREAKTDVASFTDSEEEELVLAAKRDAPPMA